MWLFLVDMYLVSETLCGLEPQPYDNIPNMPYFLRAFLLMVCWSVLQHFKTLSSKSLHSRKDVGSLVRGCQQHFQNLLCLTQSIVDHPWTSNLIGWLETLRKYLLLCYCLWLALCLRVRGKCGERSCSHLPGRGDSITVALMIRSLFPSAEARKGKRVHDVHACSCKHERAAAPPRSCASFQHGRAGE